MAIINKTGCIRAALGVVGGIPTRWGVWAEGKAYRPLDKVSRNGSGYVCTKANTGVDPETDVNGEVEGEYWLLIAAKGDRGIGISGIDQTAKSDTSGYPNTLRVEMEDGQATEFVVHNGQSGARVIRVTSDESSEDGGVNTITFCDDEGALGTVQVRNGTKGNKGDKGNTPEITCSTIDFDGGCRIDFYADNRQISSFKIYNGEGDMDSSLYDSTNEVRKAGGIVPYVQDAIRNAMN